MTVIEEYSFSKLSSFEQCPYKYNLTYNEHRKGRENAFAQYGTLCHSILEQCAKDEIAVYEMLDLFDLGFATEISEAFPPNEFVDLASSYYNSGVEFFKNFGGFDGIDIVGVEQEFKIEIEHPDENYLLRGFVDLIYRDSDGLVVRDYKSKSKFKNKDEQRKYARQLYTYAEYVKRQYGEYPKRMEFYMFRKNEIINVPFMIEALDETIRWANDAVSRIRAEQDWNPVHDDWFCQWLCDQRDTCPHRGGGNNV